MEGGGRGMLGSQRRKTDSSLKALYAARIAIVYRVCWRYRVSPGEKRG